MHTQHITYLRELSWSQHSQAWERWHFRSIDYIMEWAGASSLSAASEKRYRKWDIFPFSLKLLTTKKKLKWRDQANPFSEWQCWSQFPWATQYQKDKGISIQLVYECSQDSFALFSRAFSYLVNVEKCIQVTARHPISNLPADLKLNNQSKD
jgi:hypothetical protein